MLALMFVYVILAVCFGVLTYLLDDFTPVGKVVVPVMVGLLWPPIVVAVLLIIVIGWGSMESDDV